MDKTQGHAWSLVQTKFYLNSSNMYLQHFCIHVLVHRQHVTIMISHIDSCCRDGHMPIVILCTMLPSIQTMAQKLRISSSSTTFSQQTEGNCLCHHNCLLKTNCQQLIKSTCCKTINKHLRTEPTMTLRLITSGTDPETSFCIVLTG